VKIAPRIGHHAQPFGQHSEGAVAYVALDQNPEQYRQSFDAAATIDLLEEAIRALKSGDGTAATKACGAAWFRISTFHHS
jgi:hypothetical protein